jgi:glycosyltransferase involved in cell wall biosynthesis
MDRSRIAVIVPAYNEEQTIAEVTRGILPYGVPIVVDDASKDRTADMAEQAGAVVVRHKTNQGYDGALDSGFSAAATQGMDYAITMDADGQHAPEILQHFIERFDQSFDLVVGIRPKNARVAERLFSLVIRTLYGIRDPMCGMKGYNLAFYRKLGHFDSYQSIGTELMLYCLQQGCRTDQFPVPIRHRTGGSPRFGRTLSANYRILRALVLGLVLRRTHPKGDGQR